MDQGRIEYVGLTSEIVKHVVAIAELVARGERMYKNGADPLLDVFGRTCRDTGLWPAEAEQPDTAEEAA